MKKIKFLTAIVTCTIILVLITAGIAAASGNYASWAEPSIIRAAELGLLTENVKKDYIRALTREDFCELVVNMFERRVGDQIEMKSNPFTDTSNPMIIKAFSLGIINGTSSTTFSPKNSVTREQAAVILVNAVREIENVRSVRILVNNVDSLPFSDSNRISSWAMDNMKVAYANGIMKGDGANVRPLANVSSQESVILILNVYNMQEADPQDIGAVTPPGNQFPSEGGQVPPTGKISVTIDGGNIPLKIKETTLLSYTLSDANAVVSNVTWSSSAKSIATVDPNGNVVAIGKGSARITLKLTANDVSITDTKTIHVEPPIVALNSVAVTNPVRTIRFGDSLRFNVQLSPTTATVQRVEWSSSDTSVATIDDKGTITTKGAGTTTIKVVVTAMDGSKKEATATLNVTAAVAVNSITFSNASTEPMFVGTSRAIVASVMPTGALITSRSWKSSNTSVAAISDSGRVTAISNGTTTISLETVDRTGGKFSASFVLTVKSNYVSSFTLGQSVYNVKIGETITPELVLSPADAIIRSVSFSFSSSPTGIASVSSGNKTVTGKAAGTGVLTVSVTFEDRTNHTAQATINVLPMPIEAISFTASKTVLQINNRVADSRTNVSYRITPSNATYTSIVFSSSDESVATVTNTSSKTVSGTRTVNAEGPGKCMIIMSVFFADGSHTTQQLEITVI